MNQHQAGAVIDLADAPSPQLDERLARLGREWRRRNDDEVAASLESKFFAARFSGDETVIRRQSESFVDLFRGRTRVLDLGSGRGTFLELLRDTGIGGYRAGAHPQRTQHLPEPPPHPPAARRPAP